MLALPTQIPRATYRLQLNSEFTFENARNLVPYLKRLGISDIYTSPILQASTKSTHGYDVNDYNRISTDLGGRENLERLSEVLRQEGIGLLLDFVPNHMGIDGTHNHWWNHVLENGPKSKYASYFDIEWHPRLDRLSNRVLVPILSEPYGTVLEKGDLSIQYEAGLFFLQYVNRRIPLSPETYSLILDQVDGLLDSSDARKARLRKLGDAFESLPFQIPEECARQLASLKQEFEETVRTEIGVQQLLNQALLEINGSPANPLSFEFLHELLERQHYRLAHWKVGAHEVNYRRFFAVDTLVGLKMEDAHVFDATHVLLSELIGAEIVTGIRLDHIDGLWNPIEYLNRLQRLVGTSCRGATIYTIVEKILAPGEELPPSWAVHGTTGYEFTANLIELFLDPADESAWTSNYESFIGESGKSLDQTYQDKLFILREMFPNAVSNLSLELDTLIESDWRWRDISLHDLKTALPHLLACLSIYRTYRMSGEEMAPNEKQRISQAVEDAVRRNPCIDPVPVRFVGRVIAGDYPDAADYLGQRQAFENWVCKLQQVTGAIMAKSVEDTHFYRHVRMVAANEVGSHPSRFGLPVQAFHDANLQRQKDWPLCQITTSTHDTKVSEDARARLFALAEFPKEWSQYLSAWHEINKNALSEVGGKAAPDTREEYLLYQTLLAAWPLGLEQADDDFTQRMKSYFRKAQGEAKLNTAWTYPHAKWHAAGERFIEKILKSRSFLNSFVPFAKRIANRGMIFSLSQTMLKLASPGVPDIYQGNEIWDFSLVDPDNRRPVDYQMREDLLAGLENRSPADLMGNWQDGGIKMRITQSLLRCRSEFPELFSAGDYNPLKLRGSKADQVVAFSRKLGSVELLVVAPRRLGPVDSSWLGGYWEDTHILYSKPWRWRNVFTGRTIETGTDTISLSDLLSELPVAILILN